jgi:predicted nuclease of predicted toxin-antitoxin system
LRLLFDEQLSELLLQYLHDLSPDALHVRLVGLAGQGDEVLWQHAINRAACSSPRTKIFTG